MKKKMFLICTAMILISVIFAACNGAEGGKVTDTNENMPVLTELESELSSMADRVTDMTPDMTGNISDSNVAM